MFYCFCGAEKEEDATIYSKVKPKRKETSPADPGTFKTRTKRFYYRTNKQGNVFGTFLPYNKFIILVNLNANILKLI